MLPGKRVRQAGSFKPCSGATDVVLKGFEIMHIYICIYVYLYIICIFVYMYICIYVYMNICVYVYMCICVYVYMCICVYVYMCICISSMIAGSNAVAMSHIPKVAKQRISLELWYCQTSNLFSYEHMYMDMCAFFFFKISNKWKEFKV